MFILCAQGKELQVLPNGEVVHKITGSLVGPECLGADCGKEQPSAAEIGHMLFPQAGKPEIDGEGRYLASGRLPSAPTLGHPGCKNPGWWDGKGTLEYGELRGSAVTSWRYIPLDRKDWGLMLDCCPAKGCGLPLTPPEEPLPACRLCEKGPQGELEGQYVCNNPPCGMYRILLTRADWIKLMGPD